MLIDLHCHTSERSDDSSLPLKRLGNLARERGLDAVCITDHDAFWPPDALAEASAESGVLLIPGAEINTDAGHVLVFGLSQYRFGFHRPETLVEAVLAAGGAMILAHPYRRALPHGVNTGSAGWKAAIKRAGTNELLRAVDAVEVANGRGSPEQNRFAAEVAGRCGLPATASSDTHAASDAGAAATCFDREVASAADLVRELKAGRFRPAGEQLLSPR